MEESCWEILGIEITKDKLAIKKAYAKLAHQISPEDDPDGFRRIHTAYKQAIAYASGNSRPPFIICRSRREKTCLSSSERERRTMILPVRMTMNPPLSMILNLLAKIRSVETHLHPARSRRNLRMISPPSIPGRETFPMR